MTTVARVPDDSTYVDVSVAAPQNRLQVTLENGATLYFEYVVRGIQQEKLMVLDQSIPGAELQVAAAHTSYRYRHPRSSIDTFELLFYVYKDGERHTRSQPRVGQDFCLWIGKSSDQSIATQGYTLPGGPVTSIEWVDLPLG